VMKKNKLVQEFIKELHKVQGRDELLDFLEQILTPRELEEISHRYEILRLLEQGYTQRDIAAKLGVGIATVSRGARELKKRTGI